MRLIGTHEPEDVSPTMRNDSMDEWRSSMYMRSGSPLKDERGCRDPGDRSMCLVALMRTRG